MRPMHGGMMGVVQEWTMRDATDEPRSVVAKLHPRRDDPALRFEERSLRWYAQHTALPVPRVYALADLPNGTCLLMQRLEGNNLEAARLAPLGRRSVMLQLADHLARLHQVRRETYGPAWQQTGQTRWLDNFRPAFRAELEAVGPRLDARTRWIAGELADSLEAWLPEFNQPTLVHGDLWATNIIVNDAQPQSPLISGFIDASAVFREVEYELAYLRLFRTVDRDFFDRYHRAHPPRHGFERRCLVYWLYFTLLHVRTFGNQYLKNCASLAQRIQAAAQKS